MHPSAELDSTRRTGSHAHSGEPILLCAGLGSFDRVGGDSDQRRRAANSMRVRTPVLRKTRLRCVSTVRSPMLKRFADFATSVTASRELCDRPFPRREAIGI
jgi:hypothetical protein